MNWFFIYSSAIFVLCCFLQDAHLYVLQNEDNVSLVQARGSEERNICTEEYMWTRRTYKTRCKCKTGYRVVKSEFDNESCHGPCTNNPCKNAGTCVDVTGGYTCDCSKGFTGPNCTIVDLCVDGPCKSGGTCSMEEDEFKCSCPVPYSGETCDENPCTSSPCLENSMCVFDETGHLCLCQPPYTGEKCKDIECDCIKDKCEQNAKTGEMQCVCPPHYGLYSKNYCKACECGRDANCTFERGLLSDNKICLCPGGGQEINEPCKDACTENPCRNGGTCLLGEGDSFNCSCKTPYTGNTCEISPCDSDPCHNGGVCEIHQNSFRCRCDEPYSGDRCEISPCSSSPCQNGATCQVEGKTFKCRCDGNYYGLNCQMMCNCINGKCEGNDVSKRCECNPGYAIYNEGHCTECGCGEGHNCTRDYISTQRTYKIRCKCRNGYRALRNIFDIEFCYGPCTNNPCKNGGKCVDVTGGFTCDCPEGFTGPKCTTVDLCVDGPCKNGGTCSMVEDAFKCSCPVPYSGEKCDENPCTSSPCLNDGMCVFDDAGFVCLCKPPYVGDTCRDSE